MRLDHLTGAVPQGKAELKRRLFALLDRVFDRLGHIHFAGDRADNLFRIARVRFPLNAHLQDGTPIPRGTPALEFHVNNPMLVDLGPRASVRQARQHDFRAVAQELRERPEWADVQVIFCLSAVSPLLALVGFENHALESSSTRRLRGWANVLRRAYGNDPNAKAPKLSILSRQQFMNLYGAET